jgi:uncharacterized LabA/DUF88 family protein
MDAIVYIDGLNLYNGSVKHTSFKWLDLGALSAALLPGRTIKRIRYFTAVVVDFQHDPQASTRQGMYLRALRTIPNLIVHRDGWFSQDARMLPQYPLAYRDPTRPPVCVQVLRMEEKRTDVDIATHLLVDCFSNDFDEAVVISNDSDLAPPIETVKSKYGKRIGVINPHRPYWMSSHLREAATYAYSQINKSLLAKCQFPPTITDAAGRTIAKPASW